MNKKMSLVGLMGVTLAFFATVRSIPNVAATGWQQIAFMIIAGGLFALPIALMSAEMSTMWSDSGGPQVWVSNALGETWGFVASWLLWIQMFFGMVMVTSTFSVLLGDALGSETFKSNNFVVFLVIIAVYWLVTILNLKFDMVKIQGSYGAIIGVYIPFIVISLLGIAYFMKHGITSTGYLADFTPAKLIPDFGNRATLPIFVGVVFIFAGVEMSSVHVNDVENPGKNYPIAVISAVLLVVLLNLITALGVANAVPQGEMALSNVMQSVEIFTKDFGIPMFVDTILSICILISIFVTLSSWALGPSKAMQHVAEEGGLPLWFQKRNKKGDPVNLVLLQASVVSIIACVFLIPGVDVSSIFLMLTIATTLIYCVVYLLIAISAIKLRYLMPDTPRTFRLGKTGNTLLWIVSGAAIIVIAAVMAVSFVPPASMPAEDTTGYIIFQAAALFVSVFSGIYIQKHKKPSWKQANAPKD